MQKQKMVLYFPYVYPWVLDLVRELQRQSTLEIRFYSHGIYGNYPWKEFEKFSYIISKISIFNEIFPSPRLFVNFLLLRPRNVILFASESFPSLILYQLSRFIKSKVILVVEENIERSYNSFGLSSLYGIKKRIIKKSYRTANCIIAESDESKKYLISLGVIPEKVQVLPHGTNIAFFSHSSDRNAALKKIGITQNISGKTTVLFSGEFSEVKGAEYVIQCASELQGTTDIVFLIPSFGNVFTKNEKILKKSINIILYKKVMYNNMPSLFSLADIVIVPSKKMEGVSSDRSPNSLIEAMASSKAVIAADCGGISTILGGAGILIPPNDSIKLSRNILLLHNDKNQRSKLGRMAKERAIRELNNVYYAEKILEHFREECGNP